MFVSRSYKYSIVVHHEGSFLFDRYHVIGDMVPKGLNVLFPGELRTPRLKWRHAVDLNEARESNTRTSSLVRCSTHRSMHGCLQKWCIGLVMRAAWLSRFYFLLWQYQVTQHCVSSIVSDNVQRIQCPTLSWSRTCLLGMDWWRQNLKCCGFGRLMQEDSLFFSDMIRLLQTVSPASAWIGTATDVQFQTKSKPMMFAIAGMDWWQQTWKWCWSFWSLDQEGFLFSLTAFAAPSRVSLALNWIGTMGNRLPVPNKKQAKVVHYKVGMDWWQQTWNCWRTF